MTAINWKNGITGAWGTAADWSGGVVPGAGDSVSIAAAGTYTVSIGAGTSYQVGTLALGAAGATLDLLGTLSLGSTFTVGAGTFILDTGGLLSGGMLRVTPTTGIVTYNGGTLSNVAFQGTMDLSAASASVTEIGGIAFAGATGTGAGAVKLTGAGSSFVQSGSGTLNNATIFIGNTTTADTLAVSDSGGSGLLDLGSALVLNDATGASLLQDSGGLGDEIVNQGIIIVSGTGTGAASLAIGGNELYNVRAIDDASNSVISASSTASGTVTGALSISDATLLNAGTLLVGPSASAATVVGKTFTALASNSLSISGNLFNNSSLLSIAATANTTGTSAATASGSLSITSNSFTNTGTLALSASASTSGTGTATTGGASASSTVTIGGANFLNSGTISLNGTTTSSATKPGKLTATDKLAITSSSFTNTGLISIGGNSTKSTLTIGANAVSATGTTPAVAATNWVNAGTISATAGTVDLFGNFTLGNFNHAGANVLIGGYDNNAGTTLTVGGSAGVITAGNGLSNSTPAQILPGGYITGGTIVDQGLGLINNYDTLDGVTYQGTLAVDQAGTNVTIVDGITLQGLGGTGPGAISIGGTITGTSAQYTNTYVYTYGNTTLDNATITMGSNNTTHTTKGVATIVNNSSYINVAESTNAGGTLVAGQLTFGPNLLLTEYAAANYLQVQNQTLSDVAVWTTTPYATGDQITNDGTFQLNSATGTMDVQAQNFTNNGTVLLSNGGTFEIDTYNQTTNAGTIIANGGALLIDINAVGPAGTQTEIPTASGGTQTITTFQTNSFTNSGTLLATGTEVQLGGTLTAGWLAHFSATGGQTYLQQYAYANDAGAVLQSGAGTAGVANQLVLGGTIIGGTIDDSGQGLVAAGGTLDGITYAGNLDPVSEAAYTSKYIDIKDGITLTGANGSGPGTVTLTNGVNLFGLGNTTLDNAAITLGAGSRLGEAASSDGTFTLGAAASLNGTLFAIGTLVSGTGPSDAFVNLGSIDADGGNLSIIGNAFDNGGALLVSGTLTDTATTSLNTREITLYGTLAANGLTNAASGYIDASGLIEAGPAGGTLANAGLIYATGALTIGEVVSGSGTLAVSYDTLTLTGAATGGTLQYDQLGTIVLDQAALVTDSIAQLAGGDVLDLASLAGASAQLGGGTLTVIQSGGGTLVYAAGGTAGLTVGTSSDGNGGIAIEAFNLASANISPNPLAFGNVHVHDSISTTLSVTNIAPGQFSETLDASVGGSGGVTASGSFAGLTAGGTDSTDLVVGLNTSSSGAISGAAIVSLSSDGRGVDGNGATAIGTQTVQVTGGVFALAAPTINPASMNLNLGAERVGGSLAGSFTLGDGTAANAYQESLVYGLSGAAGSASGTILAGSATLLGVSLATGESGTITEAGTLSLVSTGVGTSGLADTSLGSDTLTVTGKVFQTASAGLSTQTIAFGNVHVGDAVSQSVSITNTATGALVDHLLVAASEGGAGFSGGGSLNLASGAGGMLAIGLDTNSAGSFSGSLALGLTSHDLTLADLSLGTQNVTLSGAVYALAAPNLSPTALDLGAVRTGGALAGSVTLGDGSVASAYQEDLVYSLGGDVGSGSGTIASGASTDIGVSLDSSASGTITGTGTLGLVSTGVGTSGLADTTLGSDTVSVTGTVYQAAAASVSGTVISFGNVHVGDTASGTLDIANTAAGALVDQLLAQAAESGAGFSGGGSLALAAGTNGSLAVGLNTSAAGAYSGDLAVTLTSHDGQLADLALGTQNVALSGAVYALATATQVPGSVDLGDVRVGGSLAGSFSLGDGTAASAYQESLVYGLSGAGSAGGTILAGSTAALGVSLATGTSGTITSAATLSLVSTGAGTSGLADTSLDSKTVSVTGTVFQTAAGSLSAQTLSFGNVHAGGTIADSLTLTNTASGALVDDLLGTFSVTGGAFSGGGTLDLGAGASGQLTASFATGATGVQNGAVTVGLTSHDGVLADLSLATQTVSLAGTVYAYAAPVLDAHAVPLGTVRVGGSLEGSFTLTNGGSQNAYQESLIYALGSNQGTIGSGDHATLGLALATGASGTITTSGTLALTSDGQADGLGNTTLASQTVSVTGTVYQTASATLQSTTVSFGIGHVGQMETATLVIGNGATGALVDQLVASLSGFSGPFSAGSNGATIASMNNGTLTIDFLSQSAGVFNGSASLALASFDSALGSLALSGDTISLAGTADNYAQSSLAAVSGPGTFSASGTAATLNLGTPGAGSAAETLSITNSASGQADLLSGNFTVSGNTADFSNGFGTFTNLSAGQAYDFSIGLNATDPSGTYSETIVLTPTGYNASGYAGTLAAETLTVTGTVVGTYTLTTGMDTVAAGDGTDFIYAATNTLSAGDSIVGGGGVNTLVLTGAGKFNLALPTTLTGIGVVTAAELATGEQIVTLCKGTAARVSVTSAAGGSISIIGAANNDTIALGNGADSIVLGAATETVIGGSGADTYTVTGKTIGATIQAGAGANLLDVTGGGKVVMGSSLTGNFASVTLLSSTTTFVANTQGSLSIVAANTGDTITVGSANQSVSAQGGQNVHILATAAQAGVLVSNVGTGSVLELTTAGTATLNNGDTGITVQLDKASTLHLGTMGFVSAVGSNGADTITAGALNQTLTGGLGKDMLVGYSGGGDTFSDTIKGLSGDSIVNFVTGDMVDITNLGTVTKQSFVSSGGSITTAHLTGSGGSLSFKFDGNFAGTFTVASDGHGGDLITYH